MDPRRVHEHNLPFLRSQYRLDTVSGGLGLIGRDGDLLADQIVHKCRLAYVWPADQCHKS